MPNKYSDFPLHLQCMMLSREANATSEIISIRDRARVHMGNDYKEEDAFLLASYERAHGMSVKYEVSTDPRLLLCMHVWSNDNGDSSVE